jgi:hypothetical protein
MGRLPAYLFVVRHGNRLDAVDSQWHLTSPTPYDPPLTYGGWNQSKALGARIASILREREASDDAAGQDANTTQPKRKRRYKVIIHSSPFLRCIQTSIAISAGLASNPSLRVSASASIEDLPAQARPSRMNQISSFSNPAPTRSRPTISTEFASAESSQPSTKIEKSVLRLDPFLGEWAAPEYFEPITPPPKSSLMLISAVAELLRVESYNHFNHFPPPSVRVAPTALSPLWNSPGRGSPLASHSESTEVYSSSLDGLPKLKDALPASISDTAMDRKAGHRPSISDPTVSRGYTSPVPIYSVSSTQPIPAGYVAHARDACVDIDYQWDSTQEEFSWGDGGVVPEEWAAMHQRFRKGLKRLVDWYATTDRPEQMITKAAATPNPISFSNSENNDNSSAVDDDDEIDVEPVVILVSHGAGGNALAGAISNQPVIADVPTSSLTVARRRPEFDVGSEVVDPRAVASLDDALLREKLTVPDLYELKMFASTDHLLSSSATPVRLSSRSFSNLDQRFSQSPGDNRGKYVNASLGSMRRGSPKPTSSMQSPSNSVSDKGGITVGSGITSLAATRPSQANSWGLWSPKQERPDVEKASDLPMTISFSHETTVKQPVEPSSSKPQSEHKDDSSPASPSLDKLDNEEAVLLEGDEEDDKFDENGLPSFSGSGLWGTPRPPGKAERTRDFTSTKRRWTVNER